MDQQTFTQAVHDQAKELKITPKLLLFAVVALSEDPKANEGYVLTKYFKSLSEDMAEAAKAQLKSNSKRSREAGEEVLKQIDPVVLKMVELLASAIKVSLVDIEPVLALHSVALMHLSGDLRRLQKKNIKAKYPVKNMDTLQIIRHFYPDLISKAKEFAVMFAENDLHLN